MNLNAPTKLTWLLSLLLGVLALLGKAVVIPFLTANAFWVMAAGLVVLLGGTLLRGV